MDKRVILIGFVLLIFLSHSSVSYSQEEGVTNAEIMRVLVKISGDIEGLKAEVKRLDGRIDETNRKIEELNTNLGGELKDLRIEVKGDFENLRTEFKGDLENLRAEVRGDLDELRWFVGTFLSVFAIIIGGLLVAILSYVFRLSREIRPKEAGSEPGTTSNKKS